MEMLRTQPVDVLVLDMGLPGMSGVEVVKALRSRPETATLPILLMTGSGTDRSVIEGLEAGADDFLAKPVRLDELVARVRAHLRSRAAWSGVVEDELARSGQRRRRPPAHGDLVRIPKPRPRPSSTRSRRRTDSSFVEVLQLTSGDRLQPLATLQPRAPASSAAGRRPTPAAPGSSMRRRARVRGSSRPNREETDHDSPIWEAGLELIAGAPIYAEEVLVGVLLIGDDRRCDGHVPRPSGEADGRRDRLRQHPDGGGRLGAGRAPRIGRRAGPARRQVLDDRAFHSSSSRSSSWRRGTSSAMRR